MSAREGSWRRWVAPALGVAVFTLALWALHRALAGYHLRELAAAVASVPPARRWAAVALTAANYLVLTGYDALALRYARAPLPYRRTALASFLGYAVANNTGSFSILAAGGVRYRLYAAWGLSAGQVAQVVGFCTATFWVGFLVLGGAAFLAEPAALAHLPGLTPAAVRGLGALLLVLAATYLAGSAAGRSELRIGRWAVRVPPLRLVLAQVAVSAADWVAAAGVLYVLLPPEAPVSFPLVLGMFLLAQVAGLVSTVPGGLGVFEGAMVLLLAPLAGAKELVGPLVAFRAVYYLLPLGAALLLLAGREVAEQRAALGRAARTLGPVVAPAVPAALAFSTFATGAILLLSGATPALAGRLAWIRHVLPLPVLELSHFAGSLAGAGLLILSRGLQRRLDGAYYVTLGLLGVGVAASLLKGLDYEEAAALALVASALLPFRRVFYRKASLLSEPLSLQWGAAVAMVLLASLWLAYFAHRHAEISADLWWRFAFEHGAPRSLRAAVGSVAVLLLFGAARLLRRARTEPARPGPAEVDEAAAVASGSPSTEAYLAVLGDKALLFAPSRRGFLMYGVQGRSWVAMGDPVGPPEEGRELAWEFHGLADRHGGWTVFYEVGPENLPLYLDLGLTPMKIGEEARVPLGGFSLEGSARKGLRAARNRVEREGCRFEVVPPDGVGRLLPELREVSDAWLAAKTAREKGFSLGFFDEAYLRRFPCALVRREGRLVAFANLWPGGGGEELSIDLMRHAPEAPGGVMDYLFAEIMGWGREQGYRWFSLGMAPLAGFEDRALAPAWSRFGAFLFRHGENFYNFQGLRAYKAKFDPVWEPRYLVSPGGLALPRILLDVAALIAGGLRGVVAK